MSEGQSPIFSKTYDFILWLLNHTENYPRSERFRLAKRLEDGMYAFHEYLVRASRARKPYPLLCDAVVELEKVRLYVRLAHARNHMTQQQYVYAAEQLVEIGRILGGWMRTLPEGGRRVE